ncbi:MAG: GAF domain-containing sensor histidine kinase, partial [Chloroflexota bacterium]
VPLLGIYAQIYRYKNISTASERQETKWVLFGLSLWVAYIVISTFPFYYIESLPLISPLPWWAPISEVGWWVSLCILPISFTIAITRSKLWNINIVINRTLVYGGLTVFTIVIYIFVVSYIGSLLQAENQSFIAFLATALVAVLFQPIRDRIQRAVNRMMYGDRDDPVEVLSELGVQLERTGSPEDALSRITETVARTLKLPYVAIELGDTVTSYGIQKHEVIRLPLIYQAETTGFLIVGLRSPGEAFSESDIQLLENITHQAGAAAHSVKLTKDLRQSRNNLVSTREEERRRMRRNLHDGLGPTLASLTLKIDAARNLMKEDPAKAEIQLDDLKMQTQKTIQDVRTLVYDLRPPALDDLGLVGAIQNHIEINASSQPQINLDVPQVLPVLPAAVEVAIYRITLEAITNVIRHAEAQTAIVRISFINNVINLEIIDYGKGLTENISYGVGLHSMQERSDELGGSFDILPTKKGVHIHVRLPFMEQ